MRCPFRGRVERHSNELCDALVLELEMHVGPRMVRKALEAPLTKTLPPHSDRLHRGPEIGSDFPMHPTGRAAEDDLRSHCERVGDGTAFGKSLENVALFGGDLEWFQGFSRHDRWTD